MKGLLKPSKNMIKSPLNTKKPVNFNFGELSKIVGSTIISSAFVISCLKSPSPDIIFKRLSPSIVTVSSYGIHRDPFSPDSMIEYPQGTGTGFSFGGNGYIVTNNHVINDAFDIKITTQDEVEIDAQIVGKDEKHDVALLHISESRSFLPNGESRSLPNLKKCINPAIVGQSVLAIGNPYGFDHSMTSGIISGIQRSLESEDKPPLLNLLQTDAAINPGNSGGPLLDATTGCLLGVNTAIVSPSGANSGIGFAIPIDRVNNIVNMIQEKIEVEKPVQLGVTLLPDKYADVLGINGIIIADIIPNSSANKIGLVGTQRDKYNRPIIGDIIIEFKNKEIKKAVDLYKILDSLKIGDIVELKVLRSTGVESFKIKF
jgi:S1-C subfamily serine protease